MTNDDDFHYTTVTVPAAAFEDDNTLLPLIAALGVSPMAAEMMRARDSARKAPENVVVFDTETSGLSANWDQILQFAAIRANRNFEIENPDTNTINARCRVRPDVIPSPQALITTRVWPEMLDTAPFRGCPKKS